MLAKLKKIYLKSSFKPYWWSVFINPFFIIRKGLFEGIQKNANYMRGVMLDFGCGDKPYKELFRVEKYIGLDLKQSGHNHKNEEIDVFYDGKKFPFEDNYFDSCFSSEALEHVFNAEEILKELDRVLKPGGHLLLTAPFVWDEHETPYDFARYTSFGLKYLLKEANFEIIKMEKSTNYVETVFQLWNAYLSQQLLPKNIFLKLLLTPLFITPVTLLGLFLEKILPRNKNFYHNNIVVAKKIIKFTP